MSEDCLKQLSEELKKYYLKYEKQVPMVEWDDSDDSDCFDLEDIFVNIQLASGRSESTTIKKYTVYEIFDPELGSKRNIILGDPGMGKTTLCKKLVVDFALASLDFTSSFPEIEFVIFVRCRDLRESLQDYIAELVLNDPSMKDSFLQYVRKYSEKVLFLIDGLDELPSGKHEDLDKLLKERLFKKSLVMTTTRTENLRGKGEHFRNSTVYNITGFDQHDSETFVRKYFSSSDVKMAQTFTHHLRNHAELEELTGSPLCLLLLCLLWEDYNAALPTDFADLCNKLLDCLVKRFIHKKGISCSKEIIEQCLILPLSRLACQSRKEGKIYFDSINLDNVLNANKELVAMKDSKITVDNVIQLGLVSADRVKKRLSKSYRFQFIHHSFQEFLTALYVQSCIENVSGDRSCSSLKEFVWILGLRLRPWNYPLIPRFKHERVIKHLIYMLDKDELSQFFHATLNATKVLHENSCDCDKIFDCLGDIQPSVLTRVSEFFMQYLPKFVSISSDSLTKLFRKCSSSLVSQMTSLEQPLHLHTSHVLIKCSDQLILEEMQRVIHSDLCQLQTINVSFEKAPELKGLTAAWQQSKTTQTYSLLWSAGRLCTQRLKFFYTDFFLS